jgi:hypothetical protein
MKIGEEFWFKAYANASGVNVICKGPCIYGGYRVLAAAGAHTLTVYDNASAASGNQVTSAISVNTAADGTMVNGIRMENGIVANLSGDPTDGLVMVLYR